MQNLLKKKLSKNNFVYGTWNSIPSPVVSDILSNTDLDFVVIDLEHGLFSFKDVENAVRATEGKKISAIVRTQNSDGQHILKCLETGVNSILVPHVSTEAIAKQIVENCYYRPAGKRGLSPYTRVHFYDDLNLKKTLAIANKNIMVGVLIEGKQGINNFEKICKVKGIDLLYIGLFDLAQSLKIKDGSIHHPDLIKVIKKFSSIAKKNNKVLGCMSNTLQQIKLLKKNNVKFIAYLNDAGALKKYFDNDIKKIKV